MGKDKITAPVNLPDMTDYEKDSEAGEVNIEPMQVVHTPMGTTVKPAKFGMSDRVKTTEKVDMDNVEIPEGLTLVVMGILGDDMYSCIGPEGLTVRLHGSYLEKVKED